MMDGENQRGAALVATLSIVMILLPLGAFVILQARTDLQIQHNLRAELEAFYVAEAGAQHAAADIGVTRSFEQILAGPDGLAGTTDDGIFPFTQGPPAPFPYAPFQYDVRAERADHDMLRVISQGRGQNGATKVVEALIARAALPLTPAALYVGGDVTRLDLGTDGFLLSGFDHRAGDSTGEASGEARAIPALGSPRRDSEQGLRQRLSDAAAHQLVGAGGAPSIATTDALGLEGYANAFAGRNDAVRLLQAAVTERLVLGTPETPQLSIVGGDLEVRGDLSGAGVLVVRGACQVSGTINFTGLVVALGGVIFEPASHVVIVGALWRAASTDERLQLLGRGAVAYSSAVLGVVDAAFPGVLPHPPVIVGWQEQL